MAGERAAQAETTRRRHGDDFYARMGRRSWELLQAAEAGDPEATAHFARRRAARAGRRVAWLAVLEAREAVTLLREELVSRLRADAEPALALLPRYPGYSAELRRELARAEARLGERKARHQRLLDDMGRPLSADASEPS